MLEVSRNAPTALELTIALPRVLRLSPLAHVSTARLKHTTPTLPSPTRRTARCSAVSFIPITSSSEMAILAAWPVTDTYGLR